MGAAKELKEPPRQKSDGVLYAGRLNAVKRRRAAGSRWKWRRTLRAETLSLSLMPSCAQIEFGDRVSLHTNPRLCAQ